jgi:hypothetical protein
MANKVGISVWIALCGAALAATGASHAQTQTVGMFLCDTALVYKGYTVFAPKHDTMTYVINNDGRIVHEWTGSRYEPGQSVYVLANGHLLRSCMTKGKLATGGGEGGRIEEYDWNSNLVWSMDISTDTYMQHHDIRPLPNGNIIMLVVEKKTYAEVIAAGFNPSMMQPDVQKTGMMLPDAVYEIAPTLPSGGTIVWKWSVWDHLIQEFDPTKQNYGVVKDHPELINAAGDLTQLPVFWNHMNSIDYNPALDQIALSVRGNSEVWVIDHSTTTLEAAGHAGGKQGKGGDLLYRWGNPACYGAGTKTDEILYQQHDAEWVRPGCPGAGNITVFNNGLSRNYSSIDEFVPPVDSAGAYSRSSGAAFGPSALAWTYVASPPSSLYAAAISGAQRLPNGNTIIDDGTHGTFTEVTSSGEIAWKYVSPVADAGPLLQGAPVPDDPVRAGEKMNAVFRVYKYALDFPGFAGRDLTPGSFVELYPSAVTEESPALPGETALEPNYPNPFNPATTIRFIVGGGAASGRVRLAVYDLLGREVALLVDEAKAPGAYTAAWNAAGMASGVYFCRLAAGGATRTLKMLLTK